MTTVIKQVTKEEVRTLLNNGKVENRLDAKSLEILKRDGEIYPILKTVE